MNDIEVPAKPGDRFLVKSWGPDGDSYEFRIEIHSIRDGVAFLTESSELETGIIEIDEEGCWEYNPCHSPRVPMHKILRTKQHDNGIVFLCDAKRVEDLDSEQVWLPDDSLASLSPEN